VGAFRLFPMQILSLLAHHASCGFLAPRTSELAGWLRFNAAHFGFQTPNRTALQFVTIYLQSTNEFGRIAPQHKELFPA
jgi:hypothetical protein